MNNLIQCDMCGYLMTKRWSETIDGKTYCRDCVPKKRLIDSGEPTEFDGTDEIVCPYCGHRYEDSYECGETDRTLAVEYPNLDLESAWLAFTLVAAPLSIYIAQGVWQ